MPPKGGHGGALTPHTGGASPRCADISINPAENFARPYMTSLRHLYSIAKESGGAGRRSGQVWLTPLLWESRTR